MTTKKANPSFHWISATSRAGRCIQTSSLKFKPNQPLALTEPSQSATNNRAKQRATTPIRRGMGMKNEGFPGRARQTMQSPLQMTSSSACDAQSAKQESPRLFQARHAAGERVARNAKRKRVEQLLQGWQTGAGIEREAPPLKLNVNQRQILAA